MDYSLSARTSDGEYGTTIQSTFRALNDEEAIVVAKYKLWKWEKFDDRLFSHARVKRKDTIVIFVTWTQIAYLEPADWGRNDATEAEAYLGEDGSSMDNTQG